jgi:hypothetical protein
MTSASNPCYYPSQITASTLIKTSPGECGQVFCSTTSSGTIALYDSATAATNNKIVDTITLTAGQSYPLYIKFVNGLYAVIGGTASVTVTFV